MFRRYSVNFAILSIVLDALCIAASLAISPKALTLFPSLAYAISPDIIPNIPAYIYTLFPIWWVAVFLILSVYDGRRNLYIVDEFNILSIGSLLAGISLAGGLFFFYRELPRILFIAFFLLAYLLIISWRLVFRLFFRRGDGTYVQQRKVIIIGAGPVGRDLRREIRKRPYIGLNVVGFVDDDAETIELKEDILGSIKSTRQIIAAENIDDVVIALPRQAYQRVNKLVSDLHDLPVRVWVIPDYFQLALHKAVVEEFAGIPMLDLRAPAINDYQRMMKRVTDLLLTIILLPLGLFAMSLIAIAIRLESAGPVIFKQLRVGENSRLFMMYKFRSMSPGAENFLHLVERTDDEGNMIHKVEDDPRITRVGHFLRRTSLDELPQIFNVLKGEMSLVGPRPEMPQIVEKYEPWQHKRFVVPQGLTGWWQVNGRSDKPMHLHTEDDLYYVQNYSLLLDLQILFKTIGAVLRGKGAY